MSVGRQVCAVAAQLPHLRFYAPLLNSESHFCRIASWLSSTFVKATPIPMGGKINTTFPSAVNVVLA